MKPLTAHVLAGGMSTRMGRDKVSLEFEGKTLLSHALALLQNVSEEIRIVGDPAKFSAHGRTVPDVFSNRGPLGGIHAALTNSRTDLNLFIAVDMPLLHADFLRYLASLAGQGDCVVTVPKPGGRFEPLCAVYRKEFAGPAEKALMANRNKIDALFTDVSVRTVNDNELAENGFSRAMFRNVNTPEDWKLALEEFSGRDHVS